MNAVDDPQQRGILPAAATALPVGSELEITFRDGRTVQGMVGFTRGATWAECSDGETIRLSNLWQPPLLDVTVHPPPEFYSPCPKDRPRASMRSSPR